MGTAPTATTSPRQSKPNPIGKDGKEEKAMDYITLQEFACASIVCTAWTKMIVLTQELFFREAMGNIAAIDDWTDNPKQGSLFILGCTQTRELMCCQKLHCESAVEMFLWISTDSWSPTRIQQICYRHLRE